ncbi:hypothetical protein [Sulfurovum sp.]|uniref:hypothetical protein n=1 Tax=Sulfurovum sp. TaxID=1969726 RepID=UPI0025E4DA81|nr:hypothetical protein [Sulfurovum sp.]
MQNNFKPRQTEAAKKRLSVYLKEAEQTLEAEKQLYKKIRKRHSLGYKILAFFKR